MPLHDWSALGGWDGMQLLWITELLRWVKPRLPAGYRAFVGSSPLLAVGVPGASARPDVSVRSWFKSAPEPRVESTGAATSVMEPDFEVVMSSLPVPETALMVERSGRLVAAVELVSPRNKDRPYSREAAVARYAGYLRDGVHLLLVDVHRHSLSFSFADAIARQGNLDPPTTPAPQAMAYRVGEDSGDGGRLLAVWRRPLTVGASLPSLPLPLTMDQAVAVDLEPTYMSAARDAYLD